MPLLTVATKGCKKSGNYVAFFRKLVNDILLVADLR